MINGFHFLASGKLMKRSKNILLRIQTVTQTFILMTTLIWEWITLSCSLIRNTPNSKPFLGFNSVSTCQKHGITVLIPSIIIMLIAFMFVNFVWASLPLWRNWKDTATLAHFITPLGIKFIEIKRWRSPCLKWMEWKTLSIVKT